MEKLARRTAEKRIFTALVLTILVGVSMTGSADTPRELGDITWLRDYSAGQARSRETGRPIFLLFQEVPGCQTCVSFGEEVLSHPLLIEAIEDEFVPVAIYNNRLGADRRVLEAFDEPAWNNPVVRLVDAAGRDLVPRKVGVWKPGEIAARMIRALETAGRRVPPYLAALQRELQPSRVEYATLSMHCYWEGEACLGSLPGLLSSRAGHLGGREVVELRFDPAVTNYREIVREARNRGCAEAVFAHDDDQFEIARLHFGSAARRTERIATDASTRNQKFHLRRSGVLELEALTPAQATRLNNALWAKKALGIHLSPRQRKAIERSGSAQRAPEG